MLKKIPTDFQQVDQTVNKGISLSLDQRQHSFLSQGYFEYAKILFERGDQENAEDYLRQATKLFLEMKTAWELDQAKSLEELLG